MQREKVLPPLRSLRHVRTVLVVVAVRDAGGWIAARGYLTREEADRLVGQLANTAEEFRTRLAPPLPRCAFLSWGNDG